MSIYDIDLDKTPANYQPLTPLSFLARSASVYPEHIAIIHGKSRTSYASFYARARRSLAELMPGRYAKYEKGEQVVAAIW
jgi:fatty-acyl-CoA synthase